MGIPKRKNNINVYGNKPVLYGSDVMDRRQELLDSITKADSFLPDSILHDDLDRGMLDFVKTELQVVTAGGTWSSSCGTCISSTGVFDPQLAGLGTWQVCYSVGTGTCAATQCISIIVNSGCVPQITTENLNICPEDSVQIFGTWEHISGTYSASLIDVNQCDSTHIVNLNIFNVNNHVYGKGMPLLKFLNAY